LKIVFMGTGEFAVPALQALLEAGHQVSMVVSQPDRPQGRGLQLRPTPVKTAAARLGLEVFQPEKLQAEPERVIAEKPDVLVVVAYGQILREPVLSCAPHGAFNVHASLLPKYRGAAPIQWAIANGETETGVTIMKLDSGMDTGPVLRQRIWPIGPLDTTATLEPVLAALGASLLVETLEDLSKGTVEPKPQNEKEASKAPLIRKTDGLVDFTVSAPEIANRLRGFSPWPGVHFRLAGRAIRVHEADAIARDPGSAPPGAILAVSRDGLDVACASGTVLRLRRVQPESRGAVSAFDFANGAKLRAGAVLAGSAPEQD